MAFKQPANTAAQPAAADKDGKSADNVVSDWLSKQKVGKSALEPVPKDKWQILYWPATDIDGNISAGAGRAEYLRVLFEEADVPYENITDDLRKFFWQELQLQPFPVLAPPAIRFNDFVLCQTAVCAKHLAKELGLMPKGHANQLVAESHADQIVTTVHEYIAEGRMAWHPVQNTMSYNKQKEEAAPKIKAFEKERLPRYMTNFERYLKANSFNDDKLRANTHQADDTRQSCVFFVGNSVSYVDLQVMVMLQVTREQFAEAWPDLEIPLLKKFLEDMENRPNMKRYLASERKQPFAGDSLM